MKLEGRHSLEASPFFVMCLACSLLCRSDDEFMANTEPLSTCRMLVRNEPHRSVVQMVLEKLRDRCGSQAHRILLAKYLCKFGNLT